MATDQDKARARRLYKRLQERYPDAHCALIHDGPFQLLVATALSAQCTDKLVNQVTPELFAAFPDPQTLADAPLEAIEARVNRVNFWRNKSKNLKGMARKLVDLHGGEVLDGAGHADGVLTLRVDGKGQRAVGQSVRDGPVGDPKPIDHFLAHRHAAGAHAGAALQHLDPEPLAHGVAVHHLLDNRMQGRFAHDGKVGVRCT